VNLLDENFPDDQRELLQKFGVAVRQIGRDAGRYGTPDEEIFPLLHRLHGVTFLTHDRDFWDSSACHPSYCLVWLGVKQDSLAEYARRLLRHPQFDTVAKRMGQVLAVGPSGVTVFERHRPSPRKVDWTE
jgi:predicted nuclease of predicted toxin-antitoxin system